MLREGELKVCVIVVRALPLGFLEMGTLVSFGTDSLVLKEITRIKSLFTPK